MCRLFGYFSQFAGRPAALSQREHSFAQLSETHRDGWGLAYYEPTEGTPRVQLKRALQPAYQDPDFKALSQDLHTRALIAHLRLATIGENKLQNNHPFSYQNWVFAHNGKALWAHQGGQPLYYQLQPGAEGQTWEDIVFCSEPVGSPEHWQAMSTGDLIVVDQAIQLVSIRGY